MILNSDQKTYAIILCIQDGGMILNSDQKTYAIILCIRGGGKGNIQNKIYISQYISILILIL